MDHRQPTSPGLSAAPPRAHSRTFSFRSDKSGKSGTSSSRRDIESPLEKERRDSLWKGGSKANPNAAINEAQPGEVNLLEKATIEPLRNIQHRDTRGNVITDPDLSNPTRPRLERPLDTIRSFEKAIDSGYRRRTSMMRAESDQGNNYASRRSSYVGGYESGPGPNRQYQNGGYYGTRRPDSYVDGPNGPNGYPQRVRYGQRMQSDTAVMRNHNNINGNGYYGHNYQPSHETFATNGSDSTGQWANSTDPSSENSSVERMHAAAKPHGMYDSRQNAIMEDQQMHYRNDEPPRPPEHGRRPMPYGGERGPPVPRKNNLPPTTRPEPEKKKNWLSRRFSKKM